jgi:hypothetical protein
MPSTLAATTATVTTILFMTCPLPVVRILGIQ